LTIGNLYQANVGREGKDGQENSGHKKMGIDLEPPFLSLHLSRRPNLGLFEPNTAPHLREKAVEYSVMPLPFTSRIEIHKPDTIYMKHFYMSNRKFQYIDNLGSKISIYRHLMEIRGCLIKVSGSSHWMSRNHCVGNLTRNLTFALISDPFSLLDLIELSVSVSNLPDYGNAITRY